MSSLSSGATAVSVSWHAEIRICLRISQTPKFPPSHSIETHNMAAVATLPSLLSTLTDSLTSASSSLPDSKTIAPPTEGISLLDTKNELLLSYLHNLVFLIILKLRNQSTNSAGEEAASLSDYVTRKLVELRVYMEKGVRPLESRLKYQLDKLLLAASEASVPVATNSTGKPVRTSKVADDASDSDSDTSPTSPQQPSEQAYRPNPSAFAHPTRDDRALEKEKTGLYKPPRITPTSLPTTERKHKELKPRKSHTLDTFIREEIDDAPTAEPSIGAGSGLRGREKEKEEERRGYEETRLVRLPGEKKKGRRRPDEDLNGGFGGLGDVEFGDLRGHNGGKRKRDAGGEGEKVGERWEKRAKRGWGRKRR